MKWWMKRGVDWSSGTIAYPRFSSMGKDVFLLTSKYWRLFCVFSAISQKKFTTALIITKHVVFVTTCFPTHFWHYTTSIEHIRGIARRGFAKKWGHHHSVCVGASHQLPASAAAPPQQLRVELQAIKRIILSSQEANHVIPCLASSRKVACLLNALLTWKKS